MEDTSHREDENALETAKAARTRIEIVRQDLAERRAQLDSAPEKKQRVGERTSENRPFLSEIVQSAHVRESRALVALARGKPYTVAEVGEDVIRLVLGLTESSCSSHRGQMVPAE